MNERTDNYVYIFLDQRKSGRWIFEWEGQTKVFDYQPFYVGRGTGSRIMAHFQKASLHNHSFKNYKIKSIQKSTGSKPIVFKVFENLTYQESRDIEKAIILKFGIFTEGGILTNMIIGEGKGNIKSKEIGENYSRENRGRIQFSSKRVKQISLDGRVLAIHDSITLACRSILGERAEYNAGVKNCCDGKLKTSLGFKWEFEGTSAYIEPLKKNPIEKPVFQYYNGKFIQEFKSAAAAAKSTGTNSEGICMVCKNKMKSSNGYQWFYEFQGIKIESVQANSRRSQKVQCFNSAGSLVEEYKSIGFCLDSLGLSRGGNNVKKLKEGCFINDQFYKAYS